MSTGVTRTVTPPSSAPSHGYERYSTDGNLARLRNFLRGGILLRGKLPAIWGRMGRFELSWHAATIYADLIISTVVSSRYCGTVDLFLNGKFHGFRRVEENLLSWMAIF